MTFEEIKHILELQKLRFKGINPSRDILLDENIPEEDQYLELY